MKRSTATFLKILGGFLLMVGVANLLGYLIAKSDREGRKPFGEPCRYGDDCKQGLSCLDVGANRERICMLECSNDGECPEDMLCEKISPYNDKRYCKVVKRGMLVVGKPCRMTDECKTGRCVFGRIEHSGIDPTDKGAFNFGRDGICTHHCLSDSDCPDTMHCVETTTTPLINSPISDAFHKKDNRRMCFPRTRN